jgi:Siderophore biosynthesis protein domain.
VDDLAFRPLQRDELPLLHEWLARPHVARWWNEGERTLDQVVAHYLPALEGTDPTDHFMVVLDGRPVGFMETYLIADHPEWERLSTQARAWPASTCSSPSRS